MDSGAGKPKWVPSQVEATQRPLGGPWIEPTAGIHLPAILILGLGYPSNRTTTREGRKPARAGSAPKPERGRCGSQFGRSTCCPPRSGRREAIIGQVAFSVAGPLPLPCMVPLLSLKGLAIAEAPHGDPEDIHVVPAGLAPCHVLREGRSSGRVQRFLRRTIQISRSRNNSSALPNRTSPSPVSISRMASRDSAFGSLTSNGSPWFRMTCR